MLFFQRLKRKKLFSKVKHFKNLLKKYSLAGNLVLSNFRVKPKAYSQFILLQSDVVDKKQELLTLLGASLDLIE